MVSRLPHSWRPAAFVVGHLLLLAGTYYAAFLLRFDFRIPEKYLRSFLWTLPIVLVARVAALVACRLHRGLWRFSSVADVVAPSRSVARSVIVVEPERSAAALRSAHIEMRRNGSPSLKIKPQPSHCSRPLRAPLIDMRSNELFHRK